MGIAEDDIPDEEVADRGEKYASMLSYLMTTSLKSVIEAKITKLDRQTRTKLCKLLIEKLVPKSSTKRYYFKNLLQS